MEEARKDMTPILPEENARQLADIQREMLESYIQNNGEDPPEIWLAQELAKHMGGHAPQEYRQAAEQIMESLKLYAAKDAELKQVQAEGGSREAWLAEELQDSVTGLDEPERREELREVLELVHGTGAKGSNLLPVEQMSRQIAEAFNASPRQAEAIGKGLEFAGKIMAGQSPDRLVEGALLDKTASFTKTAVAGTLEIGVEKGLIPALPQGTPHDVIGGIAHLATENADIFHCVATGALSPIEGMAAMQNSSAAVVAGLAEGGGAAGASLGAKIGAVFGPAGAAVGGFIGGVVGKLSGTALGAAVVEGCKQVCHAVGSVVHEAFSAVKDVVSGLANALFGWW